MYSQELADRICDLISSGMSENQISKMAGMPSHETLRKWKNERPEFLAKSARAREESANYYAEQATAEAYKLAQTLDDVAELKRYDSNGDQIKELPSGYVEAKRVLIQQLNREAGLRNDALFGTRKTVKLESDPNATAGLSDFYKFLSEQIEENKK